MSAGSQRRREGILNSDKKLITHAEIAGKKPKNNSPENMDGSEKIVEN
jgi:hypothetical protein